MNFQDDCAEDKKVSSFFVLIAWDSIRLNLDYCSAPKKVKNALICSVLIWNNAALRNETERKKRLLLSEKINEYET